MRKLFAVVVLLASTAPVKAQLLLPEEKSFVVNMTAGLLVTTRCGAKIVPGGMVRFADRAGIKGARLTDAVTAAILAQGNNLPYDREKLIPAVTRLMVDAYVEIGADVDRDKAKNCAKWMKTLRDGQFSVENCFGKSCFGKIPANL
jgi:hypothetical protein